ncbi:MAG TPA: hypothetical protein VHA11_11060, partial [Bryobacteraceae bacterium]|nr:hypothetical protein [Bryobacteraceae bacterium]
MNRRDVLRFAGGSAAGLLLTPLPWKLLDDTSIWTQNWPWTPRLPRGEVTTRWSACTLCPEACGVTARAVVDRPFELAGVGGHPSGHGVLCPAGLVAHHVAYHPARVLQVLRRGRPATMAQAMRALRAAKGTVAIFDQRPGRAISELYRRSGLLYLTPPPREEATLAMLREMAATPDQAFGIDLERTRSLLSFGAPVLDGWAAPGRVWGARAGFRLIQAEPRPSRTSELADTWLPLRPGSEAALALGIAHCLLRERPVDPDAAGAADFVEYRALVERFTPGHAAGITGLTPEQVQAA